MVKSKLFLCVCLCVLTVLANPAKGDSIEVSNTGTGKSWTLSDLILYGDPNDPKQRKVIKAPDDPNDDMLMNPGTIKIFTADFIIRSYEISVAWFDDEGAYTELIDRLLTVRRVVPKKLACISPGPWIEGQLRTILEIDQAVAPDPPPEGTILAFVDGRNELMPGWFVGTDINFETGEVTGAYTGNVEVFAILEVTIWGPDDLPIPADGQTGVSTNPTLRWKEDPEVDSYYVYFGTDYQAVYDADEDSAEYQDSLGWWENSYDPGTLEPCTNYYWRIDKCVWVVEEVQVGEFIFIEEYEDCDSGPVWSFETAGRKATNPYPADGATDVDPNAILSWTPGCLAASHDVYFGTDFDAVAHADTNDTTGIYRGRHPVDTNSYDPGGLELGQTYHWRVDQVEADGTAKHTGDVWSFMTAGYPNECEVCLTRYFVDGSTTRTIVSSPYTFFESKEGTVEEINWDYRSSDENEVAVVYIYFKSGNALQIQCLPGADKCKMEFPQLISGTPGLQFGELTVACTPR